MRVIPYVENMLLTQNRIDNEIYVELKFHYQFYSELIAYFQHKV